MGTHPDSSMTKDPPADDGDADSEAFEEWLEQAAESKGVPKQELMNQMLSSYWILDELTGLVGQTEFEGNMEHRSPGPVESPNPDGGRETESEIPESEADSDGAKDEGENAERASTEESIREIQAAIGELIERQSAVEGQHPDGVANPLDGGVVSVVSDLQRQIGKFESKLDDAEARQSSQFDRLSNEIQLVLDRVNELERAQSTFVERGEFEAFVSETESVKTNLESIRTTTEELESRMDREFDSIEALFHRLLGALEELDSELDSVDTELRSAIESATESYREDLEPLQEREADRRRVEALKTSALQREIRRGTCESCTQTVDLALLESPVCPNCSARFSELGERSWNPLRSPKIKTERMQPDEL